jgi:hypothetical protein
VSTAARRFWNPVTSRTSNNSVWPLASSASLASFYSRSISTRRSAR